MSELHLPSDYMVPNTTSIPNIILDYLMPTLTGGEEKIVRVICRQTYGWHKLSDRISNSQMLAKSGLDEGVFKRSVKSLVEKQIIIRHIGSGRTMTEYSMNYDHTQWRGVKLPPPKITTPEGGIKPPSEGGQTAPSEGVKKTHNKRNSQNILSKEKSKETAAPSSEDDKKLHTEIKKVFDENYTELTGFRISWEGRDIRTHQEALKAIMERLKGTYEERYKEFMARARKLYELVRGDKAKQGYWWQQGFLYATLVANWNRIIPEVKHYEPKQKSAKPQSWLESGEYTDEQIVIHLIQGIENGNLLPEGWHKWEKQVLDLIGTEKLEKYKAWEATAHTTSATAAGS